MFVLSEFGADELWSLGDQPTFESSDKESILSGMGASTKFIRVNYI